MSQNTPHGKGYHSLGMSSQGLMHAEGAVRPRGSCRANEHFGINLNKRLSAAVVIAACLAAWAPPTAAGGAAVANEATSWAEESRGVAVQVSQALKTQLLREMQLSGPLRSFMVCKYSCPEILSSQSRKTGWRIAAVSLKPRNAALGMADAWEQKVLADFSRRAGEGADPAALEFAEVVSEPQASYFRYARSIVVEPLCLRCHGARDSLPDAVKAQLSVDYPFDKAVDFKVGEVYGIVSIKRDLGRRPAGRPDARDGRSR